jgi:hypothetical protein
MAGVTGTGGHHPQPARQAAGCPLPGTSNRLFLKNSRNIHEKNPRNYSIWSFVKYRENFGQAAGCPVPAWDKGGHPIVLKNWKMRTFVKLFFREFYEIS